MTEQSETLFDTPTRRGGAEILAAANTTIDALEGAGAIDQTHALKIQLIRSGATALDRELSAPKLSVAGTTLFTKVFDIAESLPTVAQAINDTFDRLVEEMRADLPPSPPAPADVESAP